MPEQTPLNDFVVAGLGVFTVFAALICIIFICNIMGAVFKRLNRADSERKGNATLNVDKSDSKRTNAEELPASGADEYVRASITNRGEVIAAISAAIAQDCGADISRIRILSVKERANSIPDRERLCAAISAVISEETGCEHVRIHSIRRLSAKPN